MVFSAAFLEDYERILLALACVEDWQMTQAVVERYVWKLFEETLAYAEPVQERSASVVFDFGEAGAGWA
jgi:hypothetical protein